MRKLGWLLALLALPALADGTVVVRRTAAPAGPGVAWVQDDLNVTPCDSTGATTIAKAFTSNVTAGSAIAVLFVGGVDACHFSGLAKTIVTDSLGNTYQAGTDLYDGTHNACLGVQYALNSTAGANTVTATFYDNSACIGAGNPSGCCSGAGTGTCTVSAGYRGIFIIEYSGVKTASAFTAVAATAGAGVAAWSSSAVTATTGDLVLGLGYRTGGGAATSSTPGASFTERATMDQVTACGIVAEDYYPAAAGSIAATGTFDLATDWLAAVIALKAQ